MAKRNTYMQWKPFDHRCRKYRKNAYISTKNCIRRSAPVVGGLFHTHDYIHDLTQWADFYFLKEIERSFWNATIRTLRHVFVEELVDKAYENAETLVESSGLQFEEDDKGRHVMVPSQPHEEFGGLTRVEWVHKQLPILLETDPPKVQPSIQIDRTYAYGTGLHVVLDVPAITVDVINDFISSFRESGEKVFRGKKRTFTAEELVFEYTGDDGKRHTSSLLEHPMSSNALCDPWDWPKDTNT